MNSIKSLKIYFSEIWFLAGSNISSARFVVALFFIVGFLDLLGLGLVGQFVAIAIGSAIPSSLDHIGLDQLNLKLAGFFLLFVFAAKTAIGVWSTRFIFRIVAKIESDLRVALLRRYQALPYQMWMLRNSSAYINSINVWVPQYARLVLMPLLRLLAESVVAFLILSFLFFINPLGLTVLLVLIASVAIIYDITFRRKNKIYANQFKNTSAQVITDVQQAMNGIKEIRVLGLENFFSKRIATNSTILCEAQAKNNTISNSARYFLEFAVVSFAVLMLFLAPEGSRTLDIVPLAAIFGVGCLRLVTLFNLITITLNGLSFYRQVVRSLCDDLKLSDATSISFEAKKNEDVFYKLQIKNLGFSYSGAPPLLFSNVNLEINSGEKVLFLGPSGSGKSTIVDIMLGILSPIKGSVLVMSLNKQYVGNSVAMYASYLSQTTFLIDDSIRRNVALGEADHLIDEVKVRRALLKAQILDITMNLPDGLDTNIGDRGLKLSGGQRQRIAIARAFYFNRTVLFLDEATNAIDLKTEKEILDDLLMDNNELTLVCISHRDELTKQFDHVYRIDNGLVIKCK